MLDFSCRNVLTETDEIIVNEVAPRPHNSGHYSIEASYTSQFENHIRAILNLPLGNTDSKVAGIMVNLVGEEGHTGQVVYENIEKIMAIDGVTPHIYGKKEKLDCLKNGSCNNSKRKYDRSQKNCRRSEEYNSGNYIIIYLKMYPCEKQIND